MKIRKVDLKFPIISSIKRISRYLLPIYQLFFFSFLFFYHYSFPFNSAKSTHGLNLDTYIYTFQHPLLKFSDPKRRVVDAHVTGIK